MWKTVFTYVCVMTGDYSETTTGIGTLRRKKVLELPLGLAGEIKWKEDRVVGRQGREN
jgi:hypothetical protein